MKSYNIDREYLREANTVMHDGQKTRISRIAGRISNEKIGNLNLIIKTDEQGIPCRKTDGSTIPMGFAQVGINAVVATVMDGSFKGESHYWDCRTYKPKLDLSDITIKLYQSAPVFKKALKSMHNTPLGQLGREIMQLEGIKGKKQLKLADFEDTVNKLRNGNSYEQALFIMLRNKFIEDGIMPIDEDGRPRDLSAMHIPVFDVNAYMSALGRDNPKEMIWLWQYYELHRQDITARITAEDFAKTIDQLKEDAPDKYAAMYQYLVDHEYITPVIPELNLTSEQLAFIQFYHNSSRHEYLTPEGETRTDYVDPWLKAVFTYLNFTFSNLIQERVGEKEAIEFDILEKNPAWLAKHRILINKYLSKLRLGDWGDREIYHNFCGIVKDLNNTIILEETTPEEPSYPEKAESMFDRAAAKRARATIESKL